MNTAPDLTDDVLCLPNISRAEFLTGVLVLAERYELNYSPADDQLYHCCEAIVIAWFQAADHKTWGMGADSSNMNLIRLFLNARGIVRFRGE